MDERDILTLEELAGLLNIKQKQLQRLADDGKLYVLEANPNPDLSFGEDFSAGAELANTSYQELLERILKLGMTYEQPWQASGTET